MTNQGSILFDVNDPTTLSRPKDISTKWSKSTVQMTNTTEFGVVTVYDNSFGASDVLYPTRKRLKSYFPYVKGSWDIHTHCEWCGQSLLYVAVIVGIDERDRSKSTVHHIGCDCLGKIFGINWYGFRSAADVKIRLINEAKKRRRVMNYSVTYAEELVWLDSLPEPLLKKNTFLVDMKRIIRSGDRIVSKKMADYLSGLMKSKEYDPKQFAIAAVEIANTTEKILGVLRLVESVDTTDEVRCKSWSSYSFVKSIFDKYERWHRPLTKKQMSALNNVYVKYKNSFSKKTTTQMTGDASEIPW
jgi:hypothetical protein